MKTLRGTFTTTALGSLIACTLIAGSTSIASANEKPSVYEELARLNPGTTSAQMEMSVTAFAKNNKRPVSDSRT